MSYNMGDDKMKRLPSGPFDAPGAYDLPIHSMYHLRISWHLLHYDRNYPEPVKRAAIAKMLAKAKEFGITLPEIDTEKAPDAEAPGA